MFLGEQLVELFFFLHWTLIASCGTKLYYETERTHSCWLTLEMRV